MAGCILPLWSAIERLVLGLQQGKARFLRVTRVRLADGQRVVGVKVPADRLYGWRNFLQQQCGVSIDRDAYDTIDLIEKDAEREGKSSAAQLAPGDHDEEHSGGGSGGKRKRQV